MYVNWEPVYRYLISQSSKNTAYALNQVLNTHSAESEVNATLENGQFCLDISPFNGDRLFWACDDTYQRI